MTDHEKVKKAFNRLSKARQEKLLSSFQEFSVWIQKRFKEEYEFLKGVLRSIWEWLKKIVVDIIIPKPPFPPWFVN